MANNESKTNAEIYREQRKARLAKAAKKKKHGKHDKLAGILAKVICIVLVVAIVLYLIGSMLTNIFCVPQKVFTAATYGNYKISIAEYNYFYMSLYNHTANTAEQINSYYSGSGSEYFDTTKSPSEQPCQETDVPEGVNTWADYFKYCAPERAFLVYTLYDKATSTEAQAAGFTISAEEQAEIDSYIEQSIAAYQEQATAGDYALDNYLSRVIGEGVTAELYKELLNKEYVAELYLAWYQEDAAESLEAADLDAYYTEHKAEIDIVSMRTFGISYAEPSEDAAETDPTYTKEEAEQRANDFIAKLNEGADFVETAVEFAPPSIADQYEEDSATLLNNQTKSSLTTIDEGLSEWAFNAERKANDTYILHLESSETYFVCMITSPAAKDVTPTSADVRHILIEVAKTTTNDAGEETDLPEETIETTKTNAYAEAEQLVEKWKENGGTEQAFIDLVAANTDDEGSASTGGLYEGINSTSSYVPEFLDWALAPHEAGDVGIIETSYGYHIMYYVGGDTTPSWETAVRNTLSQDAYSSFVLELSAEIRANISRNNTTLNFFTKRTEELIDELVLKNASASAYSYY